MDKFIVNGTEYAAQKLLGHGKGGYSYLATDPVGKAVTIKILHHEPCDYYAFGDKFASEINDYQTLKSIGFPMPELLDSDREREIIVKQFIDGQTIMDYVLTDSVTADHFAQIRLIAELCQNRGVNIDYFPTNFVVDGAGTLYYVDYECNAYDPKWNFENWGVKYWSRTPELAEYLKNKK